MPERVFSRLEMSLNANRFKLRGLISQYIDSGYAPKVVQGDVTLDSKTRTSTVAWTDWRDGMGQDTFDPQHPRRFWYSTLDTRWRGHLLRQAAATTFTGGPASNALIIGDLGNNLVVAFANNDIYFSSDGAALTDTNENLPANATDFIAVRMGGTDYAVFAHTGGYSYASILDANGSRWTNDATDTLYMAWWDGKLWGIDATGQAWYSTTIGTETTSAALPLPTGSVTDLFTGLNGVGASTLFAMTRFGLWALDFANAQWIPTNLGFPDHPSNGKGSIKWWDALYIPTGLSVYRYPDGTSAPIIQDVGLTTRDSLPNDHIGSIIKLVASNWELIALVDDAASGGGTPFIMAWNGQGWHTIYEHTSASDIIRDIRVSSVNYGGSATYRLYMAIDNDIIYIPIQQNVTFPLEASSYSFSDVLANHFTPKFTADELEIDKLAVAIHIDVLTYAGSGNLGIAYALDGSGSYTTIGNITATGRTTFLFPNNTTPTGTAFRSIQFRLRVAASITDIDIAAVIFEYRKKLQTRYGFRAQVDLGRAYKGAPPGLMKQRLTTAIESNPKVELTFRDDSGNDRNFYVDVISLESSEMTGHDERGIFNLVMVEL